MSLDRRLSTLLAAAILLLAPPLAAQDLSYEKFTLENGMTVILHEDHSLPVAAVNIWYRVGSKDESEGRSGFAHLFEHLMFMGTERVPGSQFDEIMEGGGGSNNATTSSDRTNYFESGPSNLLPTLLWLEADRLEALDDAMTQEKLDTQREVVRNERRQSYENQPYGKMWLAIDETMYPEGHPYHHPVIGSHADLQAATVEDVQAFFRRFYVPANASLVVAGDFDPAEIRPLVEQLFGTLQAGPEPDHATAAPVTLDGVRRVVLTDDVQLPRLTMAWHSPAFFQPGDAELDLLAGVLSQGASSRLQRRLVHELQLCPSVAAWQSSSELGSLFHVMATCRPDADLDQVEAIIDEEIAKVQSDGPTDAEIERVRSRIEHDTLTNLEDLLERADRLNTYQHYFGDPGSLQRDLGRYAEATARDVRTWARRVLDPDARLVLSVLAGNPRDERPALGAPRPFAFPRPETFQLANGLTVHHWERNELPLLAVKLVLPGGALWDGAGRAGLTDLTLDMLDEGTDERDAIAFAEALAQLGATFGAGAGRDHATVEMRCLRRNASDSLALFFEAVTRAAFRDDDWERVRSLRAESLKAQEDQPAAVAGNIARRLVFGDDHPHAWPVGGTTRTVGDLALGDVRRLARELLRPDGAVLLTAGAMEADALRTLLQEAQGGWAAPAAARRTPPAVPASRPQRFRVALVDRPGAVQTVVRFAWPGPGYATPDRMGIQMLNTLFGGSFTSRLNQNLREAHGYSYGAGSGFGMYRSTGYALATSQVRADVSGASLAEFLAEFARIRSGDVSEDELQKASATVRNRLVDATGGLDGILGQAETMVANGLDFSAYDEDLARIGALTAGHLNTLAPQVIAPRDGVLVLVGDRDQVMSQVSELGLELPEPELLDVRGDRVTSEAGVAPGAGRTR